MELLNPEVPSLGKSLPLPKCPSGNNCYSLCFNSACQYYPALCESDQCTQCIDNHADCSFVRYESLAKMLIQKRTDIGEEIDRGFTDVVASLDYCIKMLLSEKEKISLNRELFGLSRPEQALFRALEWVGRKEKGGLTEEEEKEMKKAQGEFNCKTVAHIIEHMAEESKKGRNVWHEEAKKQETTEAELKASKLDCFHKLRKEIENQGEKIRQTISTFYTKEKWKIWIPGFDSKITDEIDILVGFFNRPIKRVRKLFTASEHRYKAAAFHRYCDEIGHTLTIVRTEFGKVIGGYTPLMWNKPDDGTYGLDPSGETFIFSVTLNEKYTLIRPNNKAILCRSNAGPRFGGSGGVDLEIHDDCHTADNTTSFPSSFNLNGKYQNNQFAHTALSGATKNWNFKIPEYEVFVVEFIGGTPIPDALINTRQNDPSKLVSRKNSSNSEESENSNSSSDSNDS